MLVRFGAPREILRMAKPHIGTDVLKNVVRALREDIVRSGGEVRFRTPVTGLRHRGGVLTALAADGEEIGCEQAVLAVGHSARDTFFALHDAGVCMEPKAFSVGVRIEHLQEDINRALYGRAAGTPGFRPPNIRCRTGKMDAPAIRSACVRAAMWLRPRARKTLW